jgi:hypothetical protein
MTRPDRALETEVIGRAQGRASIVISLNPLQNFHSTSTTLLPKSTVEIPPQPTLRGPVSHATCAKDRISPVSIQNQEC